jgi:hypothetical protein
VQQFSVLRCLDEATNYWTQQNAEAKTTRHQTFLQGSLDGGRKESAKVPPPPYHLVVAVCIDGRKCPEKRAIVRLDPNDPLFVPTIQICAREVEGRNGTIKKFGWRFELNMGSMQTQLEELFIAGTQTSEYVPSRDEERLLAAMNSAAWLNEEVDASKEATKPTKKGTMDTWLDEEGEANREASKKGLIEVKFWRFKLGERYDKRGYRARFNEGDVEMTDEHKDVSHVTG